MSFVPPLPNSRPSNSFALLTYHFSADGHRMKVLSTDAEGLPAVPSSFLLLAPSSVGVEMSQISMTK